MSERNPIDAVITTLELCMTAEELHRDADAEIQRSRCLVREIQHQRLAGWHKMATRLEGHDHRREPAVDRKRLRSSRGHSRQS